MKKVIPVCFFIVLAISLLLIGLESGNAQVTTKGKPPKKPPKVEEKWMVTIAADEDYNLQAANYDTSNTYTDNDLVGVIFSPPSNTCACYGFHLFINRPASGTQNYAIAFKDVEIASSTPGEGIPCVLPGLDGCLDPLGCIACFLNNNTHPAEGYLSASIWIQLNSEFVDSYVTEGNGRVRIDPGFGFIHVSFHKGDPSIIPGPEYHEVYGFTDCTGLYLTKVPNDKWIIEVNQSLDFIEQYNEEEIYFIGNGNKEKTRTITKTPLEITTTPVSFKMTWEKVESN